MMSAGIAIDEISELKKLLVKKDEQIRELKETVARLEALHFGPKTEKWTTVDDTQAALFNEAEDNAFNQNDAKQQTAVVETIELGAHTRRKSKRNQGRKPISKDIPREEKIYDIDEEEKVCACGNMKTCIGADESERVKIIPAVVKVIHEKKLKYACKKCEGTTADEPAVTTAVGRKHLIPGSIADESLLAWVGSEKFEYGLPLYRQTKRLAHIGINIPRATLGNLMIKAANKGKILYDLLKEYILSGSIINADETRLQVINEPGRKAKDQSWMWVFLGGSIPGRLCVLFSYAETRASVVPFEFLKDYTGWLQTDDFSAYQTALGKINTADMKKIIRVLCWSHSRRKFFDAWKVTKSEHAKKAIEYIGKLFGLEKLRTDLSLDDFFRDRKIRADEIFKEFKEWLIEISNQTPPKGLLGRAIAYTLDNWEGLIVYVNHPLLTPSNNLAENAIRPFVIGRKNWLFCVTPEGAWASAIWYSLIESAKLNKLIPYDYLYYIFMKLPYAKSREDYMALLPFNLTQEMIKAALAQVE
ncbi:MAG: IS66 family transposase [Ignavibacteria bacterium]